MYNGIDIVDEIEPFDLMRWSRDEFYNFLDGFYHKKFGVEVEVLEAEVSFIKNGLHVRVITLRGHPKPPID